MADYRNRLIMGLAQVFEQENKPLPSITIADIVAASKVSKRTFYENFNNKEECFLALYEQNSFRILGKVIEEGQKNLNSIGSSVEDIMYSILNSYLEELLTRSNLMARLYIDILAIDQKGLELRHLILKNYALSIQNLPLPKINQVSTSELLLFLSGINELALYHLHNENLISIDELKESVQLMIRKYFS